jgi:hypothetical protein
MIKRNRDIDEHIEAEMRRRLDRTGFTILGLSKPITPVLTGRLRSSTRHEVQDDPRGLRLVVGTDVRYAPFVHDGTRYMPPRPFLTSVMRDPAVKAALHGD